MLALFTGQAELVPEWACILRQDQQGGFLDQNSKPGHKPIAHFHSDHLQALSSYILLFLSTFFVSSSSIHWLNI